MEVLEKVPQYHHIHDLLCKGVAFHHSGLLPLLKEIVEILFSKGLVKMMFCTETFAVGLNMPTKTVLFAGFKKYDDATASMRILRNDEYLQMAGRAGRRGKDDKGVVIYVPDREPIWPIEMQTMLKGAKPPIESRMDFHYDFFLKTLQASDEPLKWRQIMENSYWFQQRQTDIQVLKKKIDAAQKEVAEVPFWEECEKRYELEQRIKLTTNAARKDAQRQLDTLKNKQVGPKWVSAWATYNKARVTKTNIVSLSAELLELEDHASYMQPILHFLYEKGFIADTDSQTITKKDLCLKGILATEVNEGHALLMTELYVKEVCHALSGAELIAVLATFQERKDTEENPPLATLQISMKAKEAIQRLEQMAEEYSVVEKEIGCPLPHYWTLSSNLIEPMYRWLNDETTASALCSEYGIFEGNFIRSVLKMANMLDEWLAMATYCQHTDQIQKIIDTKALLLKDLAVTDSLYLRL